MDRLPWVKVNGTHASESDKLFESAYTHKLKRRTPASDDFSACA
jgi:hypothetical protein